MRTVLASLSFAVVLAVGMIPATGASGSLAALAALAQEEPAGIAVGDQILTAGGIDAPTLASAAVPVDAPAGSLLLERLELPAGTGGLPQSSAAPLLLYIESGALSVQDEFGFGAQLTEGDDLAIRPGVTMTISNEGSDPVSLLRIRLADDIATAVSGTPAATPAAATATIEPTVLVQIPADTLPEGADLLFLARATFSADAATGEQGHAGPIGLVVQAGSLTVLSPSGLEGAVGEGQGVGLPADTPLTATAGPDGATVLIVGLVAATDGPFTVIGAPPVTTLQLGETREVDGSEVTVTSTRSTPGGIAISLTYNNTSDTRVEFPTTDVLLVHDDLGAVWEPRGLDQALNQLEELPPGESFTARIWFDQPLRGSNYTANAFVHIEGFGALQRATWGFRFENGEVLPLPPDAVVPAEPVARGPALNDRAASDHQAGAAVEGGAPTEGELSAVLPDVSLMPEGLDTVTDISRTRAEVVAALGGSRDAETNLETWGWSANVERSCIAVDPTVLAPDAVSSIVVSAHGFADDQAAVEALTFFSDIVVTVGYQEVQADVVGSTSRLLTLQDGSGGTTAALYVQEGPALYRIGAFSPGGDPNQTVIEIASQMLGQ